MKYTLLILAFLLSSCKKDNIFNISCDNKLNSMDVIKEYLPGTYEWSYSRISYQVGGSIENPTSTGLHYKYNFLKNGRVNYYENNILKSTDNYLIDYEFRVTTYPSDSSTIIIINDTQTGQRKSFFRPYLCNDSALFYNPYSSINLKRYFKRS